MIFEAFEVKAKLDGKNYEFSFKKPSLVPCLGGGDEGKRELCRQTFDWSCEPDAKPFLLSARKDSVSPKVKGTFAML